MPIRLAQVVALGYDPAHVRLPSDYVGVQHLFPYEMACASHLEHIRWTLRVFECPSCGQVCNPSTLWNQMNLC